MCVYLPLGIEEYGVGLVHGGEERHGGVATDEQPRHVHHVGSGIHLNPPHKTSQ